MFRSQSDFIRHLYTEQTLQEQCCCNLGFLVVIGVSYKTAAALDVVLLLHHLTNLLLLLLLARCVQTQGSGPQHSQQHSHLPLTADTHLMITVCDDHWIIARVTLSLYHYHDD